MPTCRHFAPQNCLLWQRPLTEIHQILATAIFFIDGVKATIRVAIRAPVIVE